MREHRSAIAQSGAIDSIVRRKEDLQSIDALILPGGESTTIGKLLRIFDLFDPLKEEIAKGLPVFGTCAGMILLAKDVIDGSHCLVAVGAVPNVELLKLENVIITPHNIAWTDELAFGMGRSAFNSIKAISQGEVPNYVVNKEVLETEQFKKKLAKFKR